MLTIDTSDTPHSKSNTCSKHTAFPKKNDKLQVMSHAVVGFPSLTENEKAIAALVNAGIRYIELQVPFSDPVADGHTLVNACYDALSQGGSVKSTLALAKKMSRQYPDVTFILMSYLNPLYRYGLEKLFKDASHAGFKGMIIPDMPADQFEPWMPLLDELDLAPILMITPNTSQERIVKITQLARGMIYVVSRLGVTGMKTHWDDSFTDYVNTIRQHTDLPLAIGFGVKAADDLKALTGVAEVAAVCSQYIEWQRQDGSELAARNMHQLLKESALV